MTAIRRIDLGSVANLEKEIEDLCAIMATGGLRLASTFVFKTELVLIFQS